MHDTGSQSPLHLAAGRGYARLVTRLLDQGAPIDEPDGFGVTPLGDVLLTYTLLQSGGIYIEEPAKRQAVEDRLVDTLLVLLERGARLDLAEQGPCFPLSPDTQAWLEQIRGLHQARTQLAAFQGATAQASGEARVRRL